MTDHKKEDLEEDRQRRFDDTQMGKLIHSWPLIVGVFGIAFALYSGWVTTNANAATLENLRARITILETAQAVKEFQFSEILTRLNKMESKIDVLTVRSK